MGSHARTSALGLARTASREPVNLRRHSDTHVRPTLASVVSSLMMGGREVWGQPQGDLLFATCCEIRFARVETLPRGPLDAGKAVLGGFDLGGPDVATDARITKSHHGRG